MPDETGLIVAGFEDDGALANQRVLLLMSGEVR
jgi:hypothetical protein